MRKVLSFVVAVIVGGLIGTAGAPAALAESFELVEGKTFDTGLVKDFYLEGNSIPTQKRNSAMIKCPCGKRLVFGLLDTTGYSSEIQTKYVGMVLVEKKTMLGAAEIPVGAYGFGLVKPAQGDGPAKLVVYDIAGGKVAETVAAYDAALAQPAPLKVVVGSPTRLLLGKYSVEIK